MKPLSPIIYIFVAMSSMMTIVSGRDALEMLSDQLKPYVDSMNKKNILKYMDKCDYKVEQGRQNQGKLLLEKISSISIQNFDTEKFSSDMIRIMSALTDAQGLYCNSYENLQCSTKGVCECAVADESLGFQVHFKREGNSCVLSDGSICAPQEAIDEARRKSPIAAGSPRQLIQCAAKTTCVVKSNREKCTTASMTTEFERMFKEHGKKSDALTFLVQKTKEGVCVCKGVATVASTFLILASTLFITIKSYF